MIGYGMFDSACYASYGYGSSIPDMYDNVLAMSVYCSCGRIVKLDRSGMRIRMNLGKELECSKCRNQRISMEIDDLNAHFSGIVQEEDVLY